MKNTKYKLKKMKKKRKKLSTQDRKEVLYIYSIYII